MEDERKQMSRSRKEQERSFNLTAGHTILTLAFFAKSGRKANIALEMNSTPSRCVLQRQMFEQAIS